MNNVDVITGENMNTSEVAVRRSVSLKDIVLCQVPQLLSDLVLKHDDVLTPAHVFIGWFVCAERRNEIREYSVLDFSFSYVSQPTSL